MAVFVRLQHHKGGYSMVVFVRLWLHTGGSVCETVTSQRRL